jgi:hypothetical protein
MIRLNDSLMKNFKLNENYKFLIRGLLYIQDLALIGVVSLPNAEIKNECLIIPLALKGINFDETIRVLKDFSTK